jgi:Tfp pilus assembly protein PilF
VAQGEALKAWANGAPLQTDDRSRLEFSGPRNIFGLSRDDNAAALRELAAASPRPPAVVAATAAPTAINLRDRGLMFLRSEAHRPAYADFARALELDPQDPVTLDGLVRAAAALEQIGDARAVLIGLASAPQNTAAKLALSKVVASQGNLDEAARIPLGVLQSDSGNVAALEQLASVLSDAGDAARLEPVVARLVAEAPKNTWAHYYAGSLFFMQNRLDLAAQAARNAVSLDPANAKAHNLLGACLASMGQTDAARAAFDASLKADPRDPGTYVNLATLEIQAGNRERALQYFAEALTVDPMSQSAREGLASLGPPAP